MLIVFVIIFQSNIVFFFFNDPATTEIYTLSLHDAHSDHTGGLPALVAEGATIVTHRNNETDRKSTRLNSSHGYISYAVFCLKKKNHCKRIVVGIIEQ